MSLFFAVCGLIGIISGFYFSAILLLTPAVLFFIRKEKPDFTELPHEVEDKNAFFDVQKKLLEQKKQLEQYRFELIETEKKIAAFNSELKEFQNFLPEVFSPDLGNEIKILKQKLDCAIRCDIQFEMHKKSIAAAAVEAGNIRKIIELTAPDTTDCSNDLTILNEKLESIIKQRGELAIKQELKENKLAAMQQIESAYQSGKNELNKLCREYLKWKIAHTLWEKTVNTFERERQGEVMQNASKYFADITDNAYTSIRKSLTGGELTVFNSVENKNVRQLSSGTREQLLFVIRLALIEYIEKTNISNLSMPLLMDDIFVNYDIERERAAWELLKKFSHKRQIIFCLAKKTDLPNA